MEIGGELLHKPTVLVVDDTPDNLILLTDLLKDEYRVKVANGGEKALRIARCDQPPDLILLNIMMPDMDGYAVCREIRADPAIAHIPVIFLTARSEVEDVTAGLDLGAVDYLTKPITPPILKARVRNHIALKRATDFLRDRHQFLRAEVARRAQEVSAVQNVIIYTMAYLAEARGCGHSNHIRRIQFTLKALAETAATHARFSHALTPEAITTLYTSAPLYDIGKVGVPDRILLKPGPLDATEWALVRTHPAIGRDAIAAAEKALGGAAHFLTAAKDLAYGHHERWDGAGYPEGRAEEAIPLGARLMAVAEVYDAMTSWRVYRPALTHDQAVEAIAAGRGQQFDPAVVDAFLSRHRAFQMIGERFGDCGPPIQEAGSSGWSASAESL